VNIEELSLERKEILGKISQMSVEDLKALEKLIDRHADILKILKRDEAWSMVFGMVKGGALWITIVLGAAYMGLDKFTTFVKGLV